VAKVRFTSYAKSVAKAMDLIGAAEKLPGRGLIVVKPNLTLNRPPPVTTNVAAARAVVDYVQSHCRAEVAIGEGCGAGETPDVFEALGYTAMARRKGIRLIDFNTAPAALLKRKDALQLKEFWLPEVLRDAFLISLPVLKDHSMTVTGVAMKNLFGLAPAPYYKGSWNKSKLHSPSTHKSIVDICLYKPPDLCVVDAAVVLTGAHISGTPRKTGFILASFDPVAVDAVGSGLLGHDPKKIKYLRLADGLVGRMDDVEIVEG